MTGTAAPPLTPGSRLQLADLSIVRQDDGFIVGNPARGSFAELPQIGVDVIAELQAGQPIGDVTAAFAEPDGPGVDVLDFAQTLLDLGFVRAIDGTVLPGHDTTPPGRWLTGPRPETIRWLFSRPAWVLYVLLFAGCTAVLAAAPAYRPRPGDYFFLADPLASIAVLTVISFAVVGAHECFHWLAGSAEGVSARFSVSRRLYFLVFETDLTQLWSLPRRRHYGPLLAGMISDTLVLSATITARLAGVGGTAGRLLAAVGLLAITNLVWQFCVFLRNDLYLVLSAALGCMNLWQVAMLSLKQTLWRLTPAEQTELADADERTRRHARWYRWLCVVGVAGAGWFAAVVVAPAIWRVVIVLAQRLSRTPAVSAGFWEAVVFGGLALLPLILLLYVLVRDLRGRTRQV